MGRAWSLFLVLSFTVFFGLACETEEGDGGSFGGKVGETDTTEAGADVDADSQGDLVGEDGLGDVDDRDGVVIPPSGGDIVAQEVTIGLQPIGGVCGAHEDCEPGTCVDAYFGGYCTVLCGGDSDCPQSGIYGATCMTSPETGQRMCWKKCVSDWDCRSDQFCAGSHVKVCVAKCQPGQCKSGLTCNVDTGRCTNQLVECVASTEVCDGLDNDCNGSTDEGCGLAPNLVEGVDYLDLGTVVFGGGGLSQEVSVSAPADATSMTLVAEGLGNDLIMFWSLKAPDGAALLAGSDFYGALNRTTPGDGVTAVLVPGNSQVTLQEGKHSFSLYKDGAVDAVHLSALFKRVPISASGTLKLNLYFVALGYMTAGNSTSNTRFVNAIEHLKNVYAQVGVSLEVEGRYDIGGSEGQQYSHLDLTNDASDERQKLLKLSAMNPGSSAVNIFFVQDIDASDYSGSFDVLGIAGGIPGPPLFQGINGAGVVVNMSDFNSFWASDYEISHLYGEVIAHEVGHQLGLFHTSEQTGDVHDQLSDTATCTNDQNGDGFVDGNECWANGSAKNLMFWQATGAVTLSNQQGAVMRANPGVF